MSVDTDLEKLRLRIGDTNVADSGAQAVFKDSELNYIIAAEPGDIEAQALVAFRMAAAKYARAYDFETDGQRFWREQQYKAYLALAKELTARGVTTSTGDVASVTTVDVTKIDGYSDDIANQDVSGGTVNPRQRYYIVGGRDLP